MTATPPRIAPQAEAAPEGVVSALLCAVWSRGPVPVAQTVALSEGVRGAACAAGDGHPLLVGRSDDQGPRQDGQHARYLPFDADGDGWIDHVLVSIPGGLPAQTASILSDRLATVELDRTGHWRRPGGRPVPSFDRDPPVWIQPRTTWGPVALAANPAGLPLPLRHACRWHSVTPYVLARHPKRHGDGRPKRDADGQWRDGPEDQLRRDLHRLRLPTPQIGDLAEAQVGGRAVRWRHFRQRRLRGGGRRADLGGYGFTLTFPEPVAGPIAAGYGHHFGLGLFLPTP